VKERMELLGTNQVDQAEQDLRTWLQERASMSRP